MLEQTQHSPQSGGSPTAGSGTPFPISPLKKAAVLITIILLSTLQIAFGALSITIINRHSGYGRRGAWRRPWNEDGVPGMAIFNGILSLIIFGGNGLSELHPSHPWYSRNGAIFGAMVMLWFNGMSLLQNSIGFAWHFLSFGKEDRDAYWLGVWSVCFVTAIGLNVAATVTYVVLAGKSLERESAEANVDEARETALLLGNGTQSQGS